MYRRGFSTNAFFKKIQEWTLNGTTADVLWAKSFVDSQVDAVPVLAQKAYKATINGDPHETKKRDGTIDPFHASGKISTKSGRSLTSFHAYTNGSVIFSKKEFNIGNFNMDQSSHTDQSSQTSSGFKTGISWQMNPNNNWAQWWDGAAWQDGQWSDEHQKWICYYNGEWYTWE